MNYDMGNRLCQQQSQQKSAGTLEALFSTVPVSWRYIGQETYAPTFSH